MTVSFSTGSPAADTLLGFAVVGGFVLGLISWDAAVWMIRDRKRTDLMYRPGDYVRLTAFHRTQDHRQVIVSLNVGDVLQVAGYVTGSPDVRLRFLNRPNRTVLVPAAKVVRCAVPAADVPERV